MVPYIVHACLYVGVHFCLSPVTIPARHTNRNRKP